jgi:hypothetical protein
MFGFLRSKQKPELSADLVKETLATCTEVFKKTWLGVLHKSISGAELAAEMEYFSTSAFKFMFEKFPVTRTAPPFVLWLAVFTAVAEAKTHPTSTVNEAVELLRRKYVQ